MKLGERQELFMRLLPRLIDKAHELGFEIRGGSLFRDPRLHGGKGVTSVMHWLEDHYPEIHTKAEMAGYSHYGSKNSEHKDKCAIDLNLFRNGVFLFTGEDHRDLGSWWEAQHPNCRWGGRFQDANHYELLAQPREET